MVFEKTFVRITNSEIKWWISCQKWESQITEYFIAPFISKPSVEFKIGKESDCISVHPRPLTKQSASAASSAQIFYNPV